MVANLEKEMEVERFKIEGLAAFTPRVFEDDRGHFFESFNKVFFENNISSLDFKQDNQSLSKKNVLRGLHFQNPPFDQGKLVRVIAGSVIDVAVDIRKSSPTYGEHQSIHLSKENGKVFWIPPGFAHGFLSLEDDTIFSYKCTNVYDTASEDAILWSDADLGISWNVEKPIVSAKDQEAQNFADFKSMFT